MVTEHTVVFVVTPAASDPKVRPQQHGEAEKGVLPVRRDRTSTSWEVLQGQAPPRPNKPATAGVGPATRLCVCV